ncbi:MAG: replication initiation factor domain-containing protein [Acholeplasmataceae bacterium]|jgi:DNA relaxase NicK|nr:replication initiation factor domain-containing protein [Acholeplasmataceae bacterium]
MAKKKSLSVSVKPYAEAERPVKAVSEAAAVGLSNTLPTAQSLYTYNCCLDYVKFRFNGEFDAHSDFFRNLLAVLKVKPSMYVEEHGNNGYEKKLVFDENVIFQIGGRTTRNGDGEETWLMEMSGSSCRDFDTRGCSWIDLLSLCLKHRGICTRVDVAIDDFTGNISVDEIKYRVFHKLYTMPMRSWKKTGTSDILGEGVEIEDKDDVRSIESLNNGFTADFGTKYSKQLSIYNKKAERLSKEYAVFVKSWLRYEGRFFKESAVSAVNIILASLQDNTFVKTVAGLIRGLVEFKEKNNLDHRHRYMAPVWKKWDNMLHSAEKITFVNQAKIETSLARKHEWLLEYAGKTLVKAYLANPGAFDKLMAFIFNHAVEKLDNSDISSINKLRRQDKRKDVTLESSQQFIKDNFEKESDDPYISAVFYRYI